eukprot:jgi/Mesvir1/12977/Mv05989-RA.1
MAATNVFGVRTRSMKPALLPAMTKFRGTKPSAKKIILPVTPSPRLEEKTPSLFGTPEEPRCDRCKHIPEEALAIHKKTGELACHACLWEDISDLVKGYRGDDPFRYAVRVCAHCRKQAVQARRGVKNGAPLKQSSLFAPIDAGILLCGKCYHSALEHHVLFASCGMQMTTDLKVDFAEEFRQYFVLDKEADEMAVRVRSQEDPYVTEKWPAPKQCGGCHKKVHLNFENLYAVPRDPIGGVILYCFDCSKTMPAERAVAMHFQGYTRPDNWFKVEGEKCGRVVPMADLIINRPYYIAALGRSQVPAESV